MNKKARHSGHRERVRRRYFEYGADSFHTHELLELALFYGIPRKNTNNIAHDLLEQFENLNGVLSAKSDELMKIEGIGESAANFICLLGDICREYETFNSLPSASESTEDYTVYLRDCFRDTAQDMLFIVCPSANFRIMMPKERLYNSPEDMVDVINLVIKRECGNLIIGINKTESAAIPDLCDISLANSFSDKLSLLGINLIDFLIIGKRRSYSLIFDGAFRF